MEQIVNTMSVKDGLPMGPASVSLHSKTVYIDEERMKSYTTAEQNAIIFHEHGHIINDSADEVAADEMGFILLVESKVPDLEAHYTWMEKELKESYNPELQLRYQLAKKRVQAYFRNGKSLAHAIGSPGYHEIYLQDEKSDANAIGVGAAAFMGGGSIIDAFDSLFSGNKRSKDARKAAEAQAAANSKLAAAQVEAAKLASRAQEKLAAIGSANTQTIVIGLVIVAVIIAMIFVLKKKKTPVVKQGPSPVPSTIKQPPPTAV